MGQNSKVVLITGATEGVGKQTAMQLAAKGFQIVMMVRNKTKAEQTKAEILQQTPNADVDYILVDLTSLKQVRAAAKIFNDKYSKIDVLINNAGLMYPDKKITDDGFELCFETNHLSHFLLTHLVLDKLKQSPQGRIINLSSEGHKLGKFDPENFNAEKGYSSLGQYCFTKLCNLYFTYSLADKLKGTSVTVNAVHPGVVKSGFGSDNNKGWQKPFWFIARLFMINNEQGAATSVFLASDPSVAKVTGKYFKNCKATATKGITHNARNRELLWDYSAENTGVGE